VGLVQGSCDLRVLGRELEGGPCDLAVKQVQILATVGEHFVKIQPPIRFRKLSSPKTHPVPILIEWDSSSDLILRQLKKRRES